MFSKAAAIAAGFTRPVVISSGTTQGACAGTIGAYVVANGALESASPVPSGLARARAQSFVVVANRRVFDSRPRGIGNGIWMGRGRG